MSNYVVVVRAPNTTTQYFGGQVGSLLIYNNSNYAMRYSFGSSGNFASATSGAYLPAQAVKKIAAVGDFITVCFDTTAGTGVTGNLEVETNPLRDSIVNTGTVKITNIHENFFTFAIIDPSSTQPSQNIAVIVDGNTTSGITTGGTVTNIVVVDLTAVFTGTMTIVWGAQKTNGGGGSVTCRLAYSLDNVTFTSLDVATATGAGVQITTNFFSQITATFRYLRVTLTAIAGGATGFGALYEATLYIN